MLVFLGLFIEQKAAAQGFQLGGWYLARVDIRGLALDL